VSELLLLPSLDAELRPDGRVSVTGKFHTGVEAFASRWEGTVRVIMEPREGGTENLDDTLVDPRELDWELEVLPFAGADFEQRMADAGVILGGLGYRQNGLAAKARELGVPFATTTEYTLKTRFQIAEADREPGPLGALKTWRRKQWEAGQERANIRAIRAAAGVQCNGTPTYEAYAPENPNTLLFFDTRTQDSDVLSDDELEARLGRVAAGEPLKLAFTGRLDPMKGARHLPAVAAALRDRGVPFTMSICGDGRDAERMRAEIAERGLEGQVKMLGVLDFQTELIPFVKEEVDLFVCPHLQGDPSCTYLETMAAGVPIAGFANEAWAGILDRVPGGWRAPLGDANALAARIAEAHEQRTILAERTRAALTFAREHTYEKSFDRRVAHLSSLR